MNAAEANERQGYDLENLLVEDDGTRLRMSCPASLLPPPEVLPNAGPGAVQLSNRRLSWHLDAWGENEQERFAAAESVFARLRGRPPAPRVSLRSYRPPKSPLLACVIVLTQNDLYVRWRLLPSLLANSPQGQIEIVVVSNGTRDIERLRHALYPIPVVASAWGQVARANNVGSALTTAPIVAFFHDDCHVSSRNWFGAVLGSAGLFRVAVSPQLYSLRAIAGLRFQPPLKVARSVPLALSRELLRETGGWNEGQYVGLEDVDFSIALAGTGAHARQVAVPSVHESGMSTILKYGHDSQGLRYAFSLGMIPPKRLTAMNRDVLNRLLEDPRARCLRDAQAHQMLDRRAEILKGLGVSRVLECREALERQHLKAYRQSLPMKEGFAEALDRGMSVAVSG